MKITKHVDKTVTADACFAHYGHSKNIGYTWISQKNGMKLQLLPNYNKVSLKKKYRIIYEITLGQNFNLIIYLINKT